MSHIVKDRIKELTSTTGTDDVVLTGAFSGFQTFSEIGDGNTTFYVIVSGDTTSWEVGIGTYTASTTTLSRDTVLESSNSGSKISLTGNSTVFCGYPADKSVYLDGSGNLNLDSLCANTSHGLIVNSLTTTQVNALSAVSGGLVYDSTLGVFKGRVAASWITLASTAYVDSAVAAITVPVTSVAGRTGDIVLTAADVSGVGILSGTNTWSGQNTFARGTITTSQPLTLTQTWNASGVTFSGLLIDITNTASTAVSKPLDITRSGGTAFFNVGFSGTDPLISGNGNLRLRSSSGASVIIRNSTDAATLFNVDGSGNTSIATAASFGWVGRGSLTSDSSSNVVCSAGLTIPNTSNLYLSNGTATGNYITSANTAVLSNNGTGQAAWNTHGFFIRKLILGYPNNDTFWTRPAAATSQLGDADAASPVAQTLSVQSVVAGTSNTAGTNFTRIQSLSTGTGTAGLGIIKSGFAGITKSAVTVTTSIATPCVVSLSNHGLPPGHPIVFATNGALPTGITAGTTYYVSATGITGNNFQIAATPTGSSIATTGSQSGTHTLSNVPTAQNPAMQLAAWGPSALTGSQTTPALDIQQTWQTNGVATGIKLTVSNLASSGTSKLLDLLSSSSSFAAATSVFSVTTAGNVACVGTLSTQGNISVNGSVIVAAAQIFTWSGRTRASSPADGQATFTNNAVTSGFTLSAVTDNTLTLLNRAGSAAGNLVAGAATFSGAITGQSTISTSDPTSGAGEAWKLGSVKAGAVALDTANYVEVMINGVVKKLLVAA